MKTVNRANKGLSINNRTAKAVVVIAVASCLWSMAYLLPTAETTTFTRPSGWIAAAILGAPSTLAEAGGLALHTGAGLVTVTRDCSGFDFFLLLFTATTWLRLKTADRRSRVLVVVSTGLATAYIATLLVNAGRVVLAVYAQHWTLCFLGEGFAHATHLAVGVLSFLPILIIACSLIERSTAREC